MITTLDSKKSAGRDGISIVISKKKKKKKKKTLLLI